MNYKELPSPTEEQMKSPEFLAIWNIVKGWDISIEKPEKGNRSYSDGTGSHVMLILNAINEQKAITDQYNRYQHVNKEWFDNAIETIVSRYDLGSDTEKIVSEIQQAFIRSIKLP